MQLPLLPRDLSTESVLEVLRGCIGRCAGLTAAELVVAVTGRRSAAEERRLRAIVEQLRLTGARICGLPNTGYHLAANADELDHTCLFLYARSMTSLRQVAAMRRVAMPDLRGQLKLPMEPQA